MTRALAPLVVLLLATSCVVAPPDPRDLADPCEGLPCDGSGGGGGGDGEPVDDDGEAPPLDPADGTEPDEEPETLLLTGYGPFEGYPVNPSWEAARALEGEVIGGLVVRTLSLPVVWDRAPAELLERVEALRPVAVVATGVAGARQDAIILERVAYNDQWGVDVEGRSRSGSAVVEDGPERLESTLPLDAIGAALTDAEVAWSFSDSAGRYLCNHLFYALVHAMAETDVPAGFVHVSDRNATVEGLSDALRVVVRATVEALLEPSSD